MQDLLEKYKELFLEGLGTLQVFQAKIDVDSCYTTFLQGSNSAFLKIKSQRCVEQVSGRRDTRTVEFSEWAAPIVAVLKSNKKSIRICGDFRKTVNPISKLDKYSIPKVEDLFVKLQNGKILQSSTSVKLVNSWFSMTCQGSLFISIPRRACTVTPGCLTEFDLPLKYSSESWIICCREFRELSHTWMITNHRSNWISAP